MKSKCFAVCLGAISALLASTTLPAQTIWDGGGGADTSWGNAANWDNDTSPAFDGTDFLTIIAPSAGNTSLTLGANRTINRIRFGAGSTALSLSGNTLILRNTTSSTTTPLWNATTSDNVAATINSNVLLEAGSAGSYTGFFRESSNSNGGTQFNGTITQGVGESWTLRFSQSAARGAFTLNNASNSISVISNNGTTLTSGVAGAFGGASLVLGGGVTGSATNDHYNTAVGNDITLSAQSAWNSAIQTRLTGALSQGTNRLIYAGSGSGFTRADYSSVSGSGITTVRSGTLWVDDMNKLSSGTLQLGNGTTAGWGSFVLSGDGGVDAPTWAEFAANRTFNASGGANTWSINVTTTAGSGGGFAARGGDVTIPHQSDPGAGGITNTTFARNFVLGSTGTLDGTRIANGAVKINTDIAFAAGEYRPAIIWNSEVVAGNAGTAWTLGGPVHELNGALSGTDVELIPLSGGSSANRGILRVTNATNSFSGSSVWVLGSTRTPWTTPGGITITSSNPDDNSGVVAIFTNDGAFGGSGVEVVVSSLGSSGTATNSLLLFEDVNGAGSTTFNQNFSLLSNTSTYTSGFGSWDGEVIYTGDVNMPSTHNTGSAIVHVRNGSLTLGTASDNSNIANSRGNATTFYKEGGGTLELRNLTFTGTQASNSWNVRGGTLLVNQALTATGITGAAGGTVGGNGSVSGFVTMQNGSILAPGNSPGTLEIAGNLSLASTTEFRLELGGGTPGDGTGFYDQVNVLGSANVNGTLTINTFGGFDANGGEFYILTRNGGSGIFTGLAEGAQVSIDGGLYTGNITYVANWGGTQGSSSLSGGDDIALYNIVGIPEPNVGLMMVAGFGLMALFRRRSS